MPDALSVGILDWPYANWLAFGLMILAGFAAYEGGFAKGRRAPSAEELCRTPIFELLAGLLALLGLLLAFTFSMALTRFDARRALVLSEANAIGTLSLRTDLLREPERKQLQDAIRRYVEIRLELVRAEHVAPERFAAYVAEAEGLQGRMWAAAVAASREGPPSPYVALVISALNDVIDLQESRVVAFRGRVPVAIYGLLLAVEIAALAAVGHGFGIVGRSDRFSPAMLIVLVAAIVMVTMDLDHSGGGFIRVSQQAMEDLGRSVGLPPAPPGPR